MVDVVDMAKRGIVKVPKRATNDKMKLNKEGYVEMINSAVSSSPEIESNPINPQASNPMIDFFGNSSSNESKTFSTEKDGYSKQEVDIKIEELDNKIYKLEQRLEVIERKTGVNQPMW